MLTPVPRRALSHISLCSLNVSRRVLIDKKCFLFSSEDPRTKNMISSLKNIAVYSEECSSVCKDSCDASDVCNLCRHCLSPKLRSSMLNAYSEHLWKGDFRRLFPPATVSFLYKRFTFLPSFLTISQSSGACSNSS